MSKKKTRDTQSEELEEKAKNRKEDSTKRGSTNKYDDKDPSSLTLWKEAVRRNGELKHKVMEDVDRKCQDEKSPDKSSRSRERVQQKTRTRDRRDRRTKNTTDTAKQLEHEELKHVNDLSQMSSDRFPPQPNTRSVVYFQNRFIILDSSDRQPGSTNSTINTDKQDNGKREISTARKMNSMETSFSKTNSATDSRIKTNRNIEMDASSVTMDARGIDIILTDPENSSKQIKNMDSFNTNESKKRKTIWRKIHGVLLDDRVKASNGQIILENRHPEEYRILKKVLNILFLTIGVTLFVSVIIVVIYAFIGKYNIFFIRNPKIYNCVRY